MIEFRERFKEELLDIDTGQDVLSQLEFVIRKIAMNFKDDDLEFEHYGSLMKQILRSRDYIHILSSLESQCATKNLLIKDFATTVPEHKTTSERRNYYVNNGVRSKLIPLDDPVPDGWSKGLLRTVH